jgi:diadenylate cyclase
VLEGLRHLFASRPPAEVARDLVDILVIAVLVYRALLVLKGTRAMQMGIGIIVFGALYFVARYAQLTTVTSLLSWLASSAVLIIVVVFQNDIRRALIRLGAKAWLTKGRDAQERVLEEVVAAATELARHRMGAIICLERDANVLEFVKSEGVELDCEVSRELLVSMFVPEAVNKLHDGAVLIRELRIACAGVFLPMPEVTKVADTSLGSRHRAAIGITEETDAVVVVVSEERGTITLCFPNGMVQNVDGNSLKQALLGLFGRSASTERVQSERTSDKAQDRDVAAPTQRPARGATRERPMESEPRGDTRVAAIVTRPLVPARRVEQLPQPTRSAAITIPPRPLELLEDEDAPLSRLSLSRPMAPTELPPTLEGHGTLDDGSPEPGPITLDTRPMHDPSVQEEP